MSIILYLCATISELLGRNKLFSSTLTLAYKRHPTYPKLIKKNMSFPENHERLPIVEVLTENEKRNRVLKWTVPSVDLEHFVKPNGRNATILDKKQQVGTIAEVARIKSDTQNAEGISIKYYPVGYIVKGRYTYNPEPNARKKRPKYTPRIYPGTENIMRHRFSRTDNIQNFARIVSGQKSGVIAEPEIESVIEWARIGFGMYGDGQFEHSRRIDYRFGVPELVFSSTEDLQKFRPFNNYRLPKDTQAVSFIASSKSNDQGVPIVARHESASDQDVEQHIKTLLMFSSVADLGKSTPILISRFTPTLEDYLRLTAKERILSIILSQREALPEHWQKTDLVAQSITAAQRELFTKRRRIPEQSPLHIDDWPEIRKKYGLKYQERISSWFNNEMAKAYNEIGSVPTVIHARELQLAKANFFSLFSSWEEAADLFRHWSGRQDFRRSFGILPKRRIKKNIINLPKRDSNHTGEQKEVQSPPAISEQID